MPAKRHDNPKAWGVRIPEWMIIRFNALCKKQGVKQGKALEGVLKDHFDRDQDK